MITRGCNLQAFVLSQTRCVGHLPLAPKPCNSTNAPQIYEMISVYHVEIAHKCQRLADQNRGSPALPGVHSL